LLQLAGFFYVGSVYGWACKLDVNYRNCNYGKLL